jgi:hypothetical protein
MKNEEMIQQATPQVITVKPIIFPANPTSHAVRRPNLIAFQITAIKRQNIN